MERAMKEKEGKSLILGRCVLTLQQRFIRRDCDLRPGLGCSSPWDVLLSCSSLYPRPSFLSFLSFFFSFFLSRLPASTKWIIRDIIRGSGLG